ncbi:MAG: hypothetical protein C4520_12005 [Candidatus Abyssobacteria bacterium SURF_5]|uniref:Uncharacterized protein n=1 Tax=Abyssobacteria bacterium (strain SURF_5) TaxID=2093360 RepID=A0A3A4NMU3_ABYX5|nr:MAG: hypothetical protein C4520_12005 [Candidatus Abyssubacteria bacterium SURF_5]
MLLLVLALLAGFTSAARGEQGNARTITLTLDRAVMPAALYHPGTLCTGPMVVTVHDFVIRNHFGLPIDSFIVQKASARVEIPIETVQEIRQTGWISKKTEDIPRIMYVVPAVITLTDGREIETIINADFGTIEGMTERGPFFLDDPHTITRLVFNR